VPVRRGAAREEIFTLTRLFSRRVVMTAASCLVFGGDGSMVMKTMVTNRLVADALMKTPRLSNYDIVFGGRSAVVEVR